MVRIHQAVREIFMSSVWDSLEIRKLIIQYSYYDNEPAGDQFITFMISESGPVIMQHGFKIIKKNVSVFRISIDSCFY